MRKIKDTIKASLWYYAKTKSTKVTPAGAYLEMNWEDPEKVYFSFSRDPRGSSYFDDFGVSDDEIYAYVNGLAELIKMLWSDEVLGLGDMVAAPVLELA